jgi:acetylornithine deacetylase/succinyl-diaminopimelate desuccinylase-like protein
MINPGRCFIAGVVLALCSGSLGADPFSAEQQRFREIYRELIEIDTTHSRGDMTAAARAMRRHLFDAGFNAADVHLFEPFPRKGNLVARYRGSGAKKPLLLLAHIDVVEAKREDWRSDPFKLQERDGVFTARGAIDDKAMASAFVSIFTQLRREGFQPERDIVLALTADEERGDEPNNGTAWLLAHQRAQIEAEFGINEGGRLSTSFRSAKNNSPLTNSKPSGRAATVRGRPRTTPFTIWPKHCCACAATSFRWF